MASAEMAHTDCPVLHVDMDAFFVSVELLERPELRGRCVVVGSASGRAVVLSASYEARKYGVRSAMPMSTARRLCPAAVIVEPHQHKYRNMSVRVMEIFRSITPLVEQVSVDEAFLDVSGSTRRLGTPLDIGRLIRRRVSNELGLPSSVGIASTKFVAKIASTRAKPDGLLLIPAENSVEFLHGLPVSALWGVGEKSRKVLSGLGISTVLDVAHTPRPTLQRLLGTSGLHIHDLAWGLDPRPVQPVHEEKSIGAEETFAEDVGLDSRLHQELLRLAHKTAHRLRTAGKLAGTISIKVRYEDFTTLTRSRKVSLPSDNAHVLYASALGLLEGLGVRPMKVRLIGLRAEQLVVASSVASQLTIDRRDENWRLAEGALDRINLRFGDSVIQPAQLLPPPEE
ncbi:DNA polymerase IV [Arthrobacter roseus]|nr:DNA polymerase IV [Arthrobacter roseus]